MYCNKHGSELLCIQNRGCMCTLPSKKMKLCMLITIIVFILLISRKKERKFIPSSTFKGYKKGFVYKMENGKLGYHADNHLGSY